MLFTNAFLQLMVNMRFDIEDTFKVMTHCGVFFVKWVLLVCGFMLKYCSRDYWQTVTLSSVVCIYVCLASLSIMILYNM